MKQYLEMPWSTDDTIEHLKEIKDHLQKTAIRADIDGKGKNDAEEIAFDFDRAIEALEKQIQVESHMKLGEAIDSIFSHNEIIALWEIDKLDKNYSNRIWKGMAWDIPDKYRDCKNWRIFGAIPDSIFDADILNIRLN